MPPARRDRSAPRRWRFATITPRAIVLLAGIASFVGALALAPLVGSEFIPDSRQQLHPLNVAHAGGHQPDARQREDAAGRGRIVRAMPEVPHDVDARSATPARHAATRRADASSSSSRASASARRSEVEEGDPHGDRSRSPGSRCRSATGRSTSPLLGPDPKVLDAEVLRLAEKVAQGARHRRPETSVQARHAGLRGAPASPTRCASSA